MMARKTRTAAQAAPAPQAAGGGGSYYLPVSIYMLFPNTKAQFSVYLKQNDKYVLYSKERHDFSMEFRKQLYQRGVETVYVLSEQKREYEWYINKHLKDIVTNEEIPLRERARVYHDMLASNMREALVNCRMEGLHNDQFKPMFNSVMAGLAYFNLTGALVNLLPQMMGRKWSLQGHSASVFCYTMAMLKNYRFDDKDAVAAGLGSLLHDIGKIKLNRAILEAKELSKDQKIAERRHPVLGMGLCVNVVLSQRTLNCIVFHHEKYDGSGYPARLKGDLIPLPVRILKVCNDWDNLTTHTPSGPALKAPEALNEMRKEGKERYDGEVFAQFGNMLHDIGLLRDE
jgi:HD-GYP domain-containing protein (c-di-GMP phosphodiesterase class II)